MKIFVYKENEKYLIDDDGQILITERPNFSFQFETILYTLTIARKDESIPLSDEEKQEIELFIENYKKANKKAFCVDNNGNYLGYIDYNEAENNKVPFPPPDSSFIWSFGKQDWQKKYFYNSTGNQVAEDLSVGYTVKMPPSENHIYSIENDEWILNDSATFDRKLMTKIKSIAVLLYYMEFVYQNQNYLNDIINNIKQTASQNNKVDLVQVCEWIKEILANCDTSADKAELERNLNEALMLVNQKVMIDINEPVFLKTDTWKSIDSI